MRILQTLGMALLIGMILVAPAQAQQDVGAEVEGILDTRTMDEAVTRHLSSSERQRLDLETLLSSEDARAVADDRGFDLSRIEAAAATLSDEEVSRVHPLVEKASAAMQQRNTITISVYTVIIFLLILILIT